jgi:hypothetical protein
MGKYTEWVDEYLTKVALLTNNATDAIASQVPTLYNGFTYDGALIKAKTRRLWTDGYLYCAQYDTYDREDTDPAHDTNGWVKLAFHNGYRDIPEIMTTSTMFAKDEIGWYKDKFYKSKINNNSWTPEVYAAGWEEIKEVI